MKINYYKQLKRENSILLTIINKYNIIIDHEPLYINFKNNSNDKEIKLNIVNTPHRKDMNFIVNF
tara:strand:+ start:80 stop:274 length:195 start_codon:yes stop_codon:yes gene_type:complete